MTIAVTGASGHVGVNLVSELIARGHRVRAVFLHRESALAGLECERVQADIRDPAAMAKALAGVDTLYHLAALISIRGGLRGAVHQINVEGVANVMGCALAAGVRRVVHCSSVHAFDLSRTDGAIDETRGRPVPGKHGAYDLSKAAGEAEVRNAIADGLDAVIINPSGIIGPRDLAPSRMGRVFLLLAQGRLPALVDGGFDWVDVRDVASSAIAAAERGRTGENYILSGTWKSTRELAAIAESLTGTRAPRLVTPMWLARFGAPFAGAYSWIRGAEPTYTGEALAALRANRTLDHRKAARELDHRPRAIEETIADLYRWLDEAGMLASRLGKVPRQPGGRRSS